MPESSFTIAKLPPNRRSLYRTLFSLSAWLSAIGVLSAGTYTLKIVEERNSPRQPGTTIQESEFVVGKGVEGEGETWGSIRTLYR